MSTDLLFSAICLPNLLHYLLWKICSKMMMNFRWFKNVKIEHVEYLDIRIFWSESPLSDIQKFSNGKWV